MKDRRLKLIRTLNAYRQHTFSMLETDFPIDKMRLSLYEKPKMTVKEYVSSLSDAEVEEALSKLDIYKLDKKLGL